MNLKKAKNFGKQVFFYLKGDKYVGKRIALGKYEPYETWLILKQAKKGDKIVDIGANIGYYTILLANRVGKFGKIYAFEPEKTNFEILVKNIKANKLKNVIAINAGVGSKKEEKILYKSDKNFGDHKLFKEALLTENNPLKEKIKIIKIDDYFKDKKIDLIKIDTQGWEPEVIKGAKKVIEENKPTVFMEYSPDSYRRAKLNKKEMVTFLRKNYKKIWWIDDWLYICKNLNQKKIDKICSTNKTGYVDLWMKNEPSFGDYLLTKTAFKFKKWVKKTLRIT